MRAVLELRRKLRERDARARMRRGIIRRLGIAAAAVLAATLSQTSALAIADSLPEWRGGEAQMRTGPVTTQPIGHWTFCKSAPEECRAGARRRPAPLTTTRWIAVNEVNALVNDVIAPRTDAEMHGIPELWSYPEVEGDCEDYVLLKRRMLIERGFRPANLLITVVRKPDGEGHAVLTVRTDRGDYVLDNLSDRVRHWSDTPYRYLKRQASYHAGRWVDIEHGTASMVGSVE